MLTFSSSSSHTRINPKSFYPIYSIIKNATNSIHIQSQQENLYTIFPNPCTTAFKISRSEPIDQVNIKIFHSDGKLIYNNLKYHFEDEILVTNIENGVYFIIIETENTKEVKKLIVI